ncbi:hypothetical protein L2E82_32854 [Cichorium intybus]|uniref:Uncharacterized protein n=1 Tax=Cichorium intybus TaxID=13427 RepID=A0ACB9BHX3_CICIN|nr:hypothetical protein L2E82_32854 [Cichorium intybus]
MFTRRVQWLDRTHFNDLLKLTTKSPLQFPPFSHRRWDKMADKETLIVQKTDDESNRPPNPFSLLFTKFTQVFNFPFPPLPPAKKDEVKVETERKAIVRGGEVVEVTKTATVTYPDGRKTTVTPLKLESEEAGQETSPAVLWQVYAIGGFFVLRWAIGRWKERRTKKKPSDDVPPSPSPTADDDQ